MKYRSTTSLFLFYFLFLLNIFGKIVFFKKMRTYKMKSISYRARLRIIRRNLLKNKLKFDSFIILQRFKKKKCYFILYFAFGLALCWKK